MRVGVAPWPRVRTFGVHQKPSSGILAAFQKESGSWELSRAGSGVAKWKVDVVVEEGRLHQREEERRD